MHKKSGCSRITLIFFNKTLAFFSASLMHDRIVLDAFARFTTISLLKPFDLIIEVESISTLLSITLS